MSNLKEGQPTANNPVPVKEIIQNKKIEKIKKIRKKSPKPKDYTYEYKGEEYTLNEKEKKFCDAYLIFGAKGVDAVYEAGYDVANIKVAYAIASENLRKPKIFNYISMHYEEHGFNDEDVTREHLFLIKQDAELAAKAKGLDMYYKKKGLYAPDKVQHTGADGGPIKVDTTTPHAKEVFDKFMQAMKEVYGHKR